MPLPLLARSPGILSGPGNLRLGRMEGEHPWSSAALPSSGPSADGGHSWSLAVVPSDPPPFCISRHRGSESRWERIKPSLLVFINATTLPSVVCPLPSSAPCSGMLPTALPGGQGECGPGGEGRQGPATWPMGNRAGAHCPSWPCPHSERLCSREASIESRGPKRNSPDRGGWAPCLSHEHRELGLQTPSQEPFPKREK